MIENKWDITHIQILPVPKKGAMGNIEKGPHC